MENDRWPAMAGKSLGTARSAVIRRLVPSADHSGLSFGLLYIPVLRSLHPPAGGVALAPRFAGATDESNHLGDAGLWNLGTSLRRIFG